jgi:predicted methyltransferase
MKLTNIALALSAALAVTACANKEAMDDQAKDMSSTKTMEAPAADAAADSKVTMTFESTLSSLLDGAHRDPANKARDQYRHPAQTLSFFGIKDDMTVIEVTPGSGWYAEILAPFLRDKGKYIAAPNDANKASSDRAKEYFGKQNDALRAKLAAHPAVYDKAMISAVDPKAPVFAPAGSADMVLTFRNVHNWVGGDNADTMFKAFFDALKPGGVLGVVEHRAADDKPWNKESGYMLTKDVVALAEKAGFKLEESSEVNANAKDTRDYAEGVWTLPPSLALGDKDREKYLAIGESDRMTLRFRKPAN